MAEKPLTVGTFSEGVSPSNCAHSEDTTLTVAALSKIHFAVIEYPSLFLKRIKAVGISEILSALQLKERIGGASRLGDRLSGASIVESIRGLRRVRT